MKISILTLAVVGAVAMTSCSKDYTCECTNKHEQSGQGFSETKEEDGEKFTISGKEDDAKSACEDASTKLEYTDGAGFKHVFTTDCELD